MSVARTMPTSGSVSGTMVEFNVLVPTACLVSGLQVKVVEATVCLLQMPQVEWFAPLQTTVDGVPKLPSFSVPALLPRALLLLLTQLQLVTVTNVSKVLPTLLPIGLPLVLETCPCVVMSKNAATTMEFNAGVQTLLPGTSLCLGRLTAEALVDGSLVTRHVWQPLVQLLEWVLVENTALLRQLPIPSLGAVLPRLPGVLKC
jgi:hypothetical protein